MEVVVEEELNYLHKKKAMTKLVQEAMTYVDQIDNLEIKLKLIDTLRELTEGKIYVEIERARLTRKLAKIKEDEGKIAEAADIMQELQVLTAKMRKRATGSKKRKRRWRRLDRWSDAKRQSLSSSRCDYCSAKATMSARSQ